MPEIELQEVESSNIEAIGYDRRTQTLRIRFHGGRLYDYPAFPEREFKAFMEADSKGRHFQKHIRPNYGHRTVTPPPENPPEETPSTPEAEEHTQPNHDEKPD